MKISSLQSGGSLSSTNEQTSTTDLSVQIVHNENQMYKENLRKEILEWSNSIPIYLSEKFEELRQNFINEFIEKIEQLRHDTDANLYNDRLTTEIKNLIDSLPTCSEKQEPKNELKENLYRRIIKLNNGHPNNIPKNMLSDSTLHYDRNSNLSKIHAHSGQENNSELDLKSYFKDMMTSTSLIFKNESSLSSGMVDAEIQHNYSTISDYYDFFEPQTKQYNMKNNKLDEELYKKEIYKWFHEIFKQYNISSSSRQPLVDSLFNHLQESLYKNIYASTYKTALKADIFQFIDSLPLDGITSNKIYVNNLINDLTDRLLSIKMNGNSFNQNLYFSSLNPFSNEIMGLNVDFNNHNYHSVGRKKNQTIDDLNRRPDYFLNDILYQTGLSTKIDKQSQSLPLNVNFQIAKEELKNQSIHSNMENKDIIKETHSKGTYKLQLEKVIKTSVPFTTKSQNANFEIFKDRIASLFILDKFDLSNDKMCIKCKNILSEDINKHFENLPGNRNDKKFKRNAICKEIYNTLSKIPHPKKYLIENEIEEIKIKCVIIDWFGTLPLQKSQFHNELIKEDKIITMLSKKLHQLMAISDCNIYDKMYKEITKCLLCFPVLPEQKQFINLFADDLQKKLQSMDEFREKCVLLPNELNKNENSRTTLRKNIVTSANNSGKPMSLPYTPICCSAALSPSNKSPELVILSPSKCSENKKCILGQGQVAGPSNERNMWNNLTTSTNPSSCQKMYALEKPAEVILDIVESWCKQLTFPTINQQDIEVVNAIKNNLIIQIITKISELNMHPEIFNDESLYEFLLNNELEILIDTLPISNQLLLSKSKIKSQLVDCIKKIKPIIKQENACYEYKENIRNTISLILDKPNSNNPDQSELFTNLTNAIADNFIEYSFYKDDKIKQNEHRKNIHDCIVAYYSNMGDIENIMIKVDTIGKCNLLFCELDKIPSPATESIIEEIQEIRLRLEDSNLFDEILPENTSLNNHLKSKLTRSISDIKKTGYNNENKTMLEQEILYTFEKLDAVINDTDIDKFVKDLEISGESRTISFPVDKDNNKSVDLKKLCSLSEVHSSSGHFISTRINFPKIDESRWYSQHPATSFSENTNNQNDYIKNTMKATNCRTNCDQSGLNYQSFKKNINLNSTAIRQSPNSANEKSTEVVPYTSNDVDELEIINLPIYFPRIDENQWHSLPPAITLRDNSSSSQNDCQENKIPIKKQEPNNNQRRKSYESLERNKPLISIEIQKPSILTENSSNMSQNLNKHEDRIENSKIICNKLCSLVDKSPPNANASQPDFGRRNENARTQSQQSRRDTVEGELFRDEVKTDNTESGDGQACPSKSHRFKLCVSNTSSCQNKTKTDETQWLSLPPVFSHNGSFQIPDSDQKVSQQASKYQQSECGVKELNPDMYKDHFDQQKNQQYQPGLADFELNRNETRYTTDSDQTQFPLPVDFQQSKSNNVGFDPYRDSTVRNISSLKQRQLTPNYQQSKCNTAASVVDLNEDELVDGFEFRKRQTQKASQCQETNTGIEQFEPYRAELRRDINGSKQKLGHQTSKCHQSMYGPEFTPYQNEIKTDPTSGRSQTQKPSKYQQCKCEDYADPNYDSITNTSNTVQGSVKQTFKYQQPSIDSIPEPNQNVTKKNLTNCNTQAIQKVSKYQQSECNSKENEQNKSIHRIPFNRHHTNPSSCPYVPPSDCNKTQKLLGKCINQESYDERLRLNIPPRRNSVQTCRGRSCRRPSIMIISPKKSLEVCGPVKILQSKDTGSGRNYGELCKCERSRLNKEKFVHPSCPAQPRYCRMCNGYKPFNCGLTQNRYSRHYNF